MSKQLLLSLLLIAAGAVLYALAAFFVPKLFEDRSLLHAEVTLVPTDTPTALIEKLINERFYSKDDETESLGRLVARLQDDPNESLPRALDELGQLDALYLITVTNQGDRPARKASLTIPKDRITSIFLIVQIDGDTPLFIESQRVELGDIEQGETRSVKIWAGAIFGNIWDHLDEVVLAHADGRGTISRLAVVDGFAGWVDRNIHWILFWIFGAPLLLLSLLSARSIITPSPKKQATPSTPASKTDSPDRQALTGEPS